MKAFKYEILITVDIIHDRKTQIVEFYIPAAQIVFNFYQGLNVFSDGGDRYERRAGGYETKELDKEFMLALTDFIKARDTLEKYKEVIGG
jgi:translation elongation factor EF-4